MTTLKVPQIDMTSFNALTKATLSATESYFRSLGEIARLAFTMNPVMTAFPDMRQCSRCGTSHLGPCSSCDMPPACWLPRCLGEIRSFVCAGGAASIRIQATNCQPQSSIIDVEIPKSASQGKVTPPSATLEPMERVAFVASFSVPANAAKGQQFETLVWVRGCNEHYIRWTIEVADGVSDSCHEICVDDCPDYVHHWYDHFYCNRRCFHTRRATSTQQASV